MKEMSFISRSEQTTKPGALEKIIEYERGNTMMKKRKFTDLNSGLYSTVNFTRKNQLSQCGDFEIGS